MEEAFKTGQVASMLGVTQRTIGNYLNDFQDFVSLEAQGIGVVQRRFYLNDIYVLNTIRLHKKMGFSSDEIKNKLEEGVVETRLPLQASFVSTFSAADVVELQKERDALLAQVDRLITQLQEINKNHLMDQQALNDRLNEHRMADQRLIGQLESRIEHLEKQLEKLLGES